MSRYEVVRVPKNSGRVLGASMALALLGACSGEGGDARGIAPDDTPSPDAVARITGTVFDSATSMAIRDATLRTSPVTEEVTTGADGTYTLNGSAGMGGEFRVFVDHLAYEGADARTIVMAGETARVDFALDRSETGLFASPTTLTVDGDEVSESFRLTSTVPNTGFSFETGDAWVTLTPPSGVIVNGETRVVTVEVDRGSLPRGGASSEIVINPDNGTGAAFVNLVVDPPTGSDRQSDCRREDVLRVGLSEPGADLIPFIDSVRLPDQSGLRRTFDVPSINPVLFDSIEVRALGTITIEHVADGPTNSVMELFELDPDESIVSIADDGEFGIRSGRASVDIALLPGVYCFYVANADGDGRLPAGTRLTLRYTFQDPP